MWIDFSGLIEVCLLRPAKGRFSILMVNFSDQFLHLVGLSAGVKVPTAVLAAENDHLTPLELVKQFEEELAAKPEVDGFVKIYPKTSHGWTTRYKAEDEAAAMEAHSDMIQWVVKYVK